MRANLSLRKIRLLLQLHMTLIGIPINRTLKPPPKKVEKSSNFRLKATRSHCLEAFIEKIEQSIFQPTNYNKKVFHNITREKELHLKK